MCQNRMFEGATEFNQDLSKWDVGGVRRFVSEGNIYHLVHSIRAMNTLIFVLL